MTFRTSILGAALLTAFSLNAFAQTNYVTVMVTNYVTVTTSVTNFVTLTNPPAAVVAAAPAKPAPAVPPVPPPPPAPHWDNSVTAGVTLTRGNSESTLATAKYTGDKKTPINEYSLEGDATYGASSGKTSAESYHGFGQWNHLFTERWYSYLRLEGLHDQIAEVKYRATLAGGAGYYFIKATNTTLSGEVGPGVVIQRVGTVDTTFATLRIAEKGEHKFFGGNARVWETVEILPQVDKWSNYLINSEVGVESALYKNISLSVFLDDYYNSEPALGRRRNDSKLVSALTYKF